MFLRSAVNWTLCAMLTVHGIAAAQTDSQVSDRPEDDTRASYAGLWLIGLLAQADDQSNRGSAASFGYGVGRSTWFSALITSSSSPDDLADISTKALVLGIDHRFEHIGLSFEIEDWGDSGTVESQDFAAEISFFNDRFEFEVGIERRDIDITRLIPRDGRIIARKIPGDADGWSLGFNVLASDAVSVYYDYRDYDYSRNLLRQPRIDVINLLNSSALTLANSFLGESHTLGVDVTFGNKIFSLAWGEDTSAIDATDLSSLGAALVLPVTPRIDLEFSLGRSDSDFFQSSTYGGIGLLIFGGG